MASVSKVTAVTTSFHLLSIYLLHFFFILTEFPLASHGCHVEDRRALLAIKSALQDPSNRLASWKEGNQHENCCDWHGIRCSNVSIRVISIDLRNTDIERYMAENSDFVIFEQIPPDTALQGRISPSLFNITDLEYLDLSYNDFQESDIPHQFSSLKKLAHLDLSFSSFSASISTQFSNLSSLQFLDLSCKEEEYSYYDYSTSCIKSSSTKWLKGLVNLQVLRARGIGLQENFGEHISYLSDLRDLDLSSCSISGSLFPKNGFQNFSRLSSLKMNHLSHSNFMFPVQMANLTSLSVLELSNSELLGSVPYLPKLEELDVSGNEDLQVDLNRMFKNQWPKLRKLWISYTVVNGSFLGLVSNASSLVSLSASSCSIQGSLPSSFSNLSQLQHLDLYHNSITGDIHSLISNLKYLFFLDLSYNNFQGNIPKSICKTLSLQRLRLNANNITGSIPSCITKLQHLRVFSAYANSIEGNVSLVSLINELNLTTLDLSSNRLTAVIDQDLHSYPLSRLETLRLGSCNLKGFPTSIICNLTHLWQLDLSRNNLSGAIPSCLFKLKYLKLLDLSHNNLTGAITFSLFKLKSLFFLDLSNNKLGGPLPLLPQSIYDIDVSNNKFCGEISIETGKRLTNCRSINLSGNKLSGPISSSLCLTDPGGSALVSYMDLSSNNLSGSIPTSIGQCRHLVSLNLGSNNFTGNIPNELELASHLTFLLLNGNNLDGTVNFISKLDSLQVLNLADNNFGGSIPTSLSSFKCLKILSLRSNKFSGSIPEGIMYLQKLQMLDLSRNNLSGSIPQKMGNLKRLLSRPNDTVFLVNMFINNPLRIKMMIKGVMVQFEKLYGYSSGLDLSCNSLDGSIPEQIGLLKSLAMLNLSHNCLSDSIPTSVGEMSGLESLDLSFNRLSGHIPQSLTGIDSLEFLNLSYNNLSGRIPIQNHFDTLSLDGSAFGGNEFLCGSPTKKVCEGDGSSDVSPTNEVDEYDGEDAKEKLLLYAIVALGVAVGFWGLFFVLLMKKQTWWFPYWRFVDSVAVRITKLYSE